MHFIKRTDCAPHYLIIRGCGLTVSNLCGEMQPFMLSNRSGLIWVGREASQAQPVPGWVASAAPWSITVLGYTKLTQHARSSGFWLIFTKTCKRKKSKNTPTSKNLQLKCLGKCLIQPCMYLDSPIIRLCIFSERQTAESLWYHVQFWASPCMTEKERKTERHLKRQTRVYSSIYSGVCLGMCMFLYLGYLFPQKAINRVFISPYMP